MQKYNKLLISSDGTIDVDQILKILKKSKLNVVGCTFDSVDVLNQVIDQIKDPLIVVDEFHNSLDPGPTDLVHQLLIANFCNKDNWFGLNRC